MQTYRSHKIVEAAPIKRWGPSQAPDGAFIIELDDEAGTRVSADPVIFARGVPAPGDYLVRYAPEGYLSWSPKAAFEEGYVPVGDTGLNFGQALARLKGGCRIARAGWNGKGMWLSLSGPLQGRKIPPESFWSRNNAEFARQNGGSANVLPCITMKTADGSILMGWLASQTDMLADDWQVAA